MIIAIDFDNCIADTTRRWRFWYDALHGAHMHREWYQGEIREWDYPRRLCPWCFRDCCMKPEALKGVELMPGAADALARIGKRHALHLVSDRAPSLRPVIHDVLHKAGVAHLFTYLHVEHLADKRAICEEIGAALLIDDSPHMLEAMRGSSCAPVCFHQHWNRHLGNVYRVREWAEVPGFVEAYERAAA